jgi:DNA-binding CsgD family transcriptional regulator
MNGADGPLPRWLAARGVTRREADVLRLIAARYRNADIAAELRISKRTVESHVGALLRKLQVHDRSALMRVGATGVPGAARVPTPGSVREQSRSARTRARSLCEGAVRGRHSALRTVEVALRLRADSRRLADVVGQHAVAVRQPAATD